MVVWRPVAPQSAEATGLDRVCPQDQTGARPDEGTDQTRAQTRRGHRAGVDVRIGRQRQPTLITSAAEPRHVDIRRREGRYLFWMAVRVLCFVLAVLLFHSWVRFLAIVVALIIPWVAVVIANGGPAPSRGRPVGYSSAAPPVDGGPRPIESGRHAVFDGDDVRPRDDERDGGDLGTGDLGTDDLGTDDRPGAGRPEAGEGFWDQYPDEDTAQPAGTGPAASDDPPVGHHVGGPRPPTERPPFAPPYTPPPPRADVGFFGPRRAPRADRRR